MDVPEVEHCPGINLQPDSKENQEELDIMISANLYFMGPFGSKPLLYIAQESADEIFSFR